MERGRPDNPHPVLATSNPAERTVPSRPRGTAVTVGQPDEVIYTIEMAPSVNFGPHWHATAQLMWPHAGSLRVVCGERSWMLVPGAAVWIPSHTTHDAFAGPSGCAFRSVYLHELDEADAGPGTRLLPADGRSLARPTPLPLDPLLLEIIDELDSHRDVDGAERARLELVMFDRLRRCLLTSAFPPDAVALPFPRDERATTIASSLLERLSDDRDLDAWGRTVGASGRTLRRLWRDETGLTFRQWRTTARMRRAYELVQEGVAVREIARAVGYLSPNAFSDAFVAHHHVRPSEVPLRRSPVRPT